MTPRSDDPVCSPPSRSYHDAEEQGTCVLRPPTIFPPPQAGLTTGAFKAACLRAASSVQSTKHKRRVAASLLCAARPLSAYACARPVSWPVLASRAGSGSRALVCVCVLCRVRPRRRTRMAASLRRVGCRACQHTRRRLIPPPFESASSHAGVRGALGVGGGAERTTTTTRMRSHKHALCVRRAARATLSVRLHASHCLFRVCVCSHDDDGGGGSGRGRGACVVPCRAARRTTTLPPPPPLLGCIFQPRKVILGFVGLCDPHSAAVWGPDST